MKPPSPRQAEVLAQIEKSIREHGYPPTLKEIGAALGTTGSHAHQMIAALERKGWVLRDPVKARGIRVIAKTEKPEETPK